ncbi:MAG: TolC family protein [bacterium]|nr:TolC family protein [bacterium]
MMQRNKKQWLRPILVLFLSFISPLWAANKPLYLSLHDAILLSLRFSPAVKGAEIQRVVDKFNLAVAKNQFEFQYALTGFANQSNSVSNGNSLFQQGVYNATPTISRQNVYGTQYNLSMANPVTVTKIPGLNSAYYNPALTLQVVQPIIQGSGREIVESNLNQAITTEKTTEVFYKAAIMNKVTQVIIDYWAVVSAEALLQFAKKSLDDAHQTVIENKERIKLGFMAVSENVQAESTVASQELQVASAEYVLLSAKNNLLRDIGLSPETKVTVNKSIAVEQANYPKGEDAKRILFANNPDYLIALNNLKNSKLSLLQAEDKQRWFLNLTGTVTQGGGAGGGANSNLQSLYNGLNRNRNLGLQLIVPIDNLPLQQQLVAAKVAYTQQQLVVQDLRLALESNLISSLENLRILFMQVKLARNAERLANQSYHDALKKIQFGQSSMFEVTTLQSTYISNTQTTINTEISYLDAVAQYQNLLGITLEKQDVNLVY